MQSLARVLPSLPASSTRSAETSETLMPIGIGHSCVEPQPDAQQQQHDHDDTEDDTEDDTDDGGSDMDREDSRSPIRRAGSPGTTL